MMLRSSLLPPLVLLSLVHGCRSDDQAATDRDSSASIGDGEGGLPALDASASDTSDAGQSCRTFVSDSLIQHACFHELMGPHADRTAGRNAGESGSDVDRPHTSFRVRLPARPQGGFGGVLSYQARLPGAYAIFARSADVRVSAQGVPLSETFAHDTQVCAVLPSVAVYSLGAQTYTLELTSAQPDVALVIEFMEEGTVADAYRTDCSTGPRAPRDAAVFTLDASFTSDAAGADDAGLGGGDGAVAPAREAGVAASNDGSASASDGGIAQVPDAAASSADAGVSDAGMCLVDPVLEHSCLHAIHGPFEALSALDPAAPPPDISRPHTAWRMTLPPAGSGRFAFRPNMEGEYVFYLDRALPLEVSSGGNAVMSTFVEPVTTCAGVSEARVFPLVRGTRYEVAVGPVAGDAVTVIVESVQAFTSEWNGRFEACQ